MNQLEHQLTEREEVKAEEEPDISQLVDKNEESEDVQAIEIATHFKLKRGDDEEEDVP